MSAPRVLVLRTAGVNCDFETEFAFERAGGQVDRLHLNALTESPQQLLGYQILAIPGGFSYGDDVAGGRVFAAELKRRLADVLGSYLSEDRLVIGICNGFQVLTNLGVLPGPYGADRVPTAALVDNDSQRYEDRWVHLKVRTSKCVFLEEDDQMFLPVAHGEGKLVLEDTALKAVKDQGLIALEYVSADGGRAGYPENPNGSIAGIAGLTDPTGRVLGLMPHPERFLLPTQHPAWTRQDPLPEHGDGARIFQKAVRYFS
ncbi:MAG: phosphoribosylformylglycinamidine synthase I [Planctomycetota bacterium]